VRNTSEVSDGPKTPRPTSSATPAIDAIDAIDSIWKEHLYRMDWLSNSIGLRAYGQRDPLIEYKAKAFKRLDALMVNIQSEICHSLFLCALSRMASQAVPAQPAADARRRDDRPVPRSGLTGRIQQWVDQSRRRAGHGPTRA
jgi:preprotein translocase subunit SecA